jgi:hypothetical protein
VIIARERGCCTADNVMDLFKRALFLGDHDPPPFTFGVTRAFREIISRNDFAFSPSRVLLC